MSFQPTRVLEHLNSKVAAEPPKYSLASTAPTQSVSYSTAHEQLLSLLVPFQPLFKNIGEKLAFYQGGFSATFSPIFNELACEKIISRVLWKPTSRKRLWKVRTGAKTPESHTVPAQSNIQA